MGDSENLTQDNDKLTYSEQAQFPETYSLPTLGFASAITHPGRVRPRNEDAVLIDPALRLVAVADGMGGHAEGSLASQLALSSLRETLYQHMNEDLTLPAASLQSGLFSAGDRVASGQLFQALNLANQQIYQLNRQRGYPSGTGMGTTLTGLWFTPMGRLLGFHIGDTRLYRFRAGQLCQLTHDHSLYQQALDQGVSQNLPSKNLLWQALGPAARIEPDILACDWQVGDLFMCCSDGLYTELSTETLAALLSSPVPLSLAALCQQLLAMALHRGARDNVSVALLSCLPPETQSNQ